MKKRKWKSEENPLMNLRAEKIYNIMKMRYSNHDARQNDDEEPGNAKQ